MGERRKRMQVWKYELKPGRNDLEFARAGEYVLIAAIGHKLFMWVEVHPDDESSPQHIEVCPTGIDIGGDSYRRLHIGSAIMPPSSMYPTPLVWHVYGFYGEDE